MDKAKKPIERIRTLEDRLKRAQLDAFIYFFIVEFGHGRYRKDKTRTPHVMRQIAPSPVSGMRRLGYPTRRVIERACARVHRACPEETRLYQRARREWREATRRLNATRTEKTWSDYLYNGKLSLSYITAVARRRKTTNVFDRLYRRYPLDMILPRKAERRRARRQQRAAQKVLDEMRRRIFIKMGVPPHMRHLA